MLKNITLSLRKLKNDYQNIEAIYKNNLLGDVLLANLMSYRLTREENPFVNEILDQYDEHLNDEGYFGDVLDLENINEEQLVYNASVLRALCEHFLTYRDEFSSSRMDKIYNGLFASISPYIEKYPLKKKKETIWNLSASKGMIFMCLDGLSYYYIAKKTSAAKDLISSIISLFTKVDISKTSYALNTLLTAYRGIYRMYACTYEEDYINLLVYGFDYFISNGLAIDYEAFESYKIKNKTSPRATINAFILAIHLYHRLGQEKYLTIARRIYLNGFQFMQRNKGEVGSSSLSNNVKPVLKIDKYEDKIASIRYLDGLNCYNKNRNYFLFNKKAKAESDKEGRIYIDDKMLVNMNNRYTLMFSLNKVAKATAQKTRLTLI